MAAHEHTLLQYAKQQLGKLPGVRWIGTPQAQASILSFTLPGVHCLDAGLLLDAQGIAVRAGHHCAQPLWQALGIEGSLRLSLAVYNTIEEIDFLASIVQRIVEKHQGLSKKSWG